MPFFVPMTEEDAYSLIEDHNPRTAEVMNTKGLINILPKKVKKILLP